MKRNPETPDPLVAVIAGYIDHGPEAIADEVRDWIRRRAPKTDYCDGEACGDAGTCDYHESRNAALADYARAMEVEG